MNDDARARLHDVLASQVNEVAAGPLGERIVARAEAERERYFTATGKETGELAQARARLAVAEGELAQAVAKRSEAHGAADELAAIRGELGGIDAKLAPQRGRVAEAADAGGESVRSSRRNCARRRRTSGAIAPRWSSRSGR